MGGNEIGAAIATNVTYILNMVLLEVIVYRKAEFDKTRAGLPDKRALRNIWEYLKIGIPGACMVCFEWWCFELLAIFSGLISVEALAAEVIIVNMVSFIFMFPLGTAYAASAFTGVNLGRGKIDQAKKYAHLTLLFNFIVTLLIVGSIWYGKNRISTLFTQDKATVEIIEAVIPILMFYICFDTFHGVLSGIIRGLGKQIYGSVFVLICYYVFGMPLALYLAFKKEMGVNGLWLGFTIAVSILVIGLVLIIECSNWSKIAADMQTKIDKEKLSNIQDSIRVGRRLRDEDYAGLSPNIAATRLIRAEALVLTQRSANRRSC